MANEVVGIDIVARLDAFREEMAKIPGITDEKAQLMAAALKKEIAGATKASQAAAKESKRLREESAKASAAQSDLADKFGDTGSIAGKFAQSLSLLSPELGATAQLVADLADGGEGAAQAQQKLGVSTGRLLAVVGPLAAAMAAAALVYQTSQREIERVNSLREFEHELAQSLVASTRQLRDAQLANAEATGAMGAAEAAALGVRHQALDTVQDYGESLRAQRKELYETIIANEGWANAQQNLARSLAVVQGYLRGRTWDEIREDAQAIEGTFDALTGWRTAIDDAKGKLDRLGDAEEEHAARQKEIRQLTIETTTATAAKTAADEAAKRALDELNAAGAEAAQRAQGQRDAYYGALDALAAQERAARQALMTERERIEAAFLAAQATAQAETDKALIIAQSVEAQETVLEQARATQLALEAQYLADLNELRAEDAKQAAESARQIADAQRSEAEALRRDLYSTGSTFMAGLEELFRATSEAMGGTSEKAAKRAFAIAQGIAAVQATLAAYEAAAKAAAAVAGIPVVGPALAVPAGIATFAAIEGAFVAKIAAQEPPSFNDTPGVQFSPRGGMVKFAAGDYFAAAKDPQELLRQALAMSASSEPRAAAPTLPRRASPPPPPPAPVVVVTQQRGTITDERVNRLRGGGLGPLSRADAQRVLGKRSS